MRCAAMPMIHRRGFTMIEMLFAGAITAVMVIFLHTIFATISSTVSLGVATSDIIRANADFTAQLAGDAQAMIGPINNGFMVLLQKQISGVRLRAGDPPGGTLRADQVAWIRSVGGNPPASPATPGAADSFAQASTDATEARVWYGHVLRTDPGGTTAPDLGVGVNQIGGHWLLGRQMLFLDLNPAAAAHIDSQWAYPNWNVTGYGGVPGAPADAWYKGLSDVFDADLTTIVNYFGFLPGFGAGYPEGPYQFTYGINRLWCNPDPPGSGASDVPVWRMAQAHPYFIGNVSDLRVDFTGPYDNTLGVTLLTKEIKWYSHFYNNPTEGAQGGKPYDPNEPVTYKPPLYFTGVNVLGFITVNLPAPLNKAIYQTNPMPNADGAFTFRPKGADWPRMLRFRYRVHDPRGQLTDRDGLPGKIFERIVKVNTL